MSIIGTPIKRLSCQAVGFIFLGLFVLNCSGYDLSKSHKETVHAGNRFHVGYRILDLEIEDGSEAKALTVAVWYPTAQLPSKYEYGGPTVGEVAVDAKIYTKQRPYPLLVFSHGYGGSGLGSVFLTEPLAARGWIVVAPDHHDRYSAVRIRRGQKKHFDRLGLLTHAREISNSGPQDRYAYLYRLNEIKLVLDWILESEQFGKFIDKKKIALGGHSFGGFTALGICGTIPDRRDDRIKGVLLFSTGAGGYLFKENELAGVKMPSMYFLGESERRQRRGAKTMAELAEKVYRNLAPPKYLLEVKDANHFSFNNRFANKRWARFLSGTHEQFKVIHRYSIAFLEKHVAQRKDADKVLRQKDALLSRYIRNP
jgi:predicted dienelactone hydrolase